MSHHDGRGHDGWGDGPLSEGVKLAARLADEFARRIPGLPDAPVSPGNRQARANAELATERAATAISGALDAYAELAEAMVSTPVAEPDELHLTWHRQGSCRVDFWLHNTTAQASPPLRVHAPPLHDHRGRSLEIKLELDGPEIHLAAGESRHVGARVIGDPPAQPGTFHGVLLTEGLPEAALKLTVAVV